MKSKVKIGLRLLAVISVVLSVVIFAACTLQNLDNNSNGSSTVQNSTTQTRAFAGLSQAVGFFNFNYCGSGQTVSWRSNCHMQDNPTGGYHDAGDHVKFNLPMAFTVSMLCWADYEYGGFSADAQIARALSYLSACWNGSTFTYQVGDGGADHGYWGSPELQTGSRPSYSTSQASAVMAQTAAAFALAYITGHTGGNLNTAKALFTAADTAKSDAGYTAANGFYTSGGFYDDLMWAAIWLYIATSDVTYLNKAESYYGNLNADIVWTQCWDDSRYGAILKLAELTGKKIYINRVETNLDWWQKGGGITYTGGGLPYLNNWGVLRYASASAFLAKIWADYTTLGTASKKAGYKTFVNNVLNYIEGSNPRNGSYIIGVGSNWPKCPHHRAASPAQQCPALHELTGALVGGPDTSDAYNDATLNYQQTEVAMDYNACLVAVLAAANGTLKSPVYPTPTPPPSNPAGTGTGLTGEYFNNMTLTAPALVTKLDASINFAWGGGSIATGLNADGTSARWTGLIEPRMTQPYTFYLRSDDGSRVYINNTLVVDNWSDHAADAQYEKSGTINLSMGTRYSIRVEFYENAGDAAIYLSWGNPWLDKEIVPTTQLYPSNVITSSSSRSSVASSVAVSSVASSVAVSSSRSSVVSSVAVSSVASSVAVSSSRSSVASSVAVSSSRSSVASSVAVSSSASSVSGGYAVNYTVNNDWGAGATCTVTIKNNSATAVNGWTLVWTYAGNQVITQIWNATQTSSGATVTVKNLAYNNIIGANGGTQGFGFNLSYSGANAKPAAFTLNGMACTLY